MAAGAVLTADEVRTERVDARPASTREALLPATSAGRWLVAAILAGALGLRLAAVAADGVYVPQNDAVDFDRIATSIANGEGYGDAILLGAKGPTAYRAPLYPATLAAVYVVAGDHSWTAGRVANAVIGVALVAVIGLVAAQLWGRRTAAVALAIAAVHPTLLLFGSGLQSEPLLALLLLGAVAAALEHGRRGGNGLWWPVTAGALAGLAALTRETGLLLVPLLAVLVWRASPVRGRRRLAAPAAVLAVAVATVVPWTIRNAVALDAFVPVTTSGGYTAAGTYNRSSLDHELTGVWMPPERDPALREVILAAAPFDEVELDRLLRSEAIDFVGNEPTAVPKVLFWNVVRLFDLQGPGHALDYATYVPYPQGLTRAAVYGSWVLGALAVGGLVVFRTWRRVPWPVLAFPALAIVFHGLVSGEIRYRASFEGFTVLLAAAAVVALLDRKGGGPAPFRPLIHARSQNGRRG